jgi:hypothetical protein
MIQPNAQGTITPQSRGVKLGDHLPAILPGTHPRSIYEREVNSLEICENLGSIFGGALDGRRPRPDSPKPFVHRLAAITHAGRPAALVSQRER